MKPQAPAAGRQQQGDEAPTLTFGPVTRTHIVRYAGASGRFTPIHHDEPVAQGVGRGCSPWA